MAACPEALYGNAAAEHAATPQLEAVLQALPQMTPDQQWLSVTTAHPSSRNLMPKEPTPAETEAFIAFAADEQSAVPALVRIQCLNSALEYACQADDPAYADLQADIDAVLPVNYLSRVSGAAQYWSESYSLATTKRENYAVALGLAREGGISPALVMPDWHELGVGDPLEMPDELPAAATLLFSRMDARNVAGTRLAPLLPLAARMRAQFPAAMAAMADDEVTNSLAYGPLPDRFSTFGRLHVPEIQALATTVGTPHERAKYMRQLELLQNTAPHIAHVFPHELHEGSMLGVRELVADSVFAVRSHLEHGGRTRSLLPLNGTPDVLPVVMSGDAPLRLLRAMTDACQRIARMQMDNGKRVITAVRGDGFSVYRLLTREDELVTYVRPFAGRAYAPDVEFGRHYEGVVASIGVTLDMAHRTGQLMEIGKHRVPGPDTRLSVRVDRDTFPRVDADGRVHRRDPVDLEGALSLDFGSVLGRRDWIGTQIGRFLALGNHLRTQAAGEPANLNHVRRHFAPCDGNALYFGAVAMGYDEALARQSLSEDEVLRQYGHVPAVV